MLCVFFCLMEGTEIVEGIAQYFADLWNVMDWLNYIIFFFVYIQVLRVQEEVTEDARATHCANSYMCNQNGLL